MTAATMSQPIRLERVTISDVTSPFARYPSHQVFRWRRGLGLNNELGGHYLMANRRRGGRETVARLTDWSGAQAAAERLAGHILRSDGFESVDPAHPLGGPDSLKDISCSWQGKQWVAAAYFPHAQQRFPAIQKKLKADARGVARNNADAFVFVTNQRLNLSKRRALQNAVGDLRLELFHLERIAAILDRPACYGVRLEFLDIEMSKDEQVAFFAQYESLFHDIKKILPHLLPFIEATAAGDVGRASAAALKVPLDEIREFSRVLDNIAGAGLTSAYVIRSAHVDKLRVPLAELKDFASLLARITGPDFGIATITAPPIQKLRVPLDQLHEYEDTLDRIIAKQARIK